MALRVICLSLAVGLLAAGCSDEQADGRGASAADATFGSAPSTPDTPLAPATKRALDRLLGDLRFGVDRTAVGTIGGSGDARLAWVVSDVLRLVQVGSEADALVAAFERLTGVTLGADELARGEWRAVTDRLIAWELPAPPEYVRYKAASLTLVEPRWKPFFADSEADIDWRIVSWGGVLIDDRPLGDPNPCLQGCIPALDDPGVTDAAGGSWYPDDAIVFGVVVGGDARAYPKNIMEIHEMVNDTLGGRRIGMPYCTLCGSAQAYFTDTVGDHDLVLRTSGLLSRSNKVMYELGSKSILDTFTGRALSGPLRKADVRLDQATVVTSSWGAWKKAHPETTIVARDGGIGREYESDPLQGRDDNGPIFPIGSVDPRLPVQEPVVGVIAPDGTPLAFPAAAAKAALRAGETVELGGVRLLLDGDGLRAVLESDDDVVSHQAFWFAWSQFNPGSAVWIRRSG